MIGVTAVEDTDYKLVFGRKAVELASASYIDEGFCVFYDIKRWISDYETAVVLTEPKSIAMGRDRETGSF